MTVSNYAGPARDYVRALIEALGARFEGTMSKATSFVVSASCVPLSLASLLSLWLLH